MKIRESLFACSLLMLAISGVVEAQEWKQVRAGAATGVAVLPDDGVVALVGGISYRSTDAGNTWTAGGVAPQNATAIRVSGNGSLFAGSTFGWTGLNFSTDGGASWSSYTNISAWDVAFNSRGYIFAATEGLFVLRSVDNGLGWTGVQGDAPPAWSIAVDPQDNVYVGTQFGGVYRSIDNGMNWNSVPIGADALVDGLAIAQDGTIYLSAATGIGLPEGQVPLIGFYRSTNQGVSWQNISAIDSIQVSKNVVITPSGTLYIAGSQFGISNSTVYTSTDRGDSWQALSQGIDWGYISGIAMDSHGRLYVAGATGIYALDITSAAPETPSEGINAVSLITAANGSGSYIAVDLQGNSQSELQLIDVGGREVKHISLEGYASGRHRFNIADLDLPQGIYLCRYSDGKHSEVVKVIAP